ncbi:MAG: tyrosine-type recombinase/integrase [Longispora sp.]|nr:tyrosine-type recombinase/integrase [Longispora sp. (in: high G+C Gram-positive bacteria)]
MLVGPKTEDSERVAPIPDRLHDLRHTVVTLLLEQNVLPHVVQAIAGHSDLAIMMKIYAQSNLGAMRGGLRRLDDQLD